MVARAHRQGNREKITGEKFLLLRTAAFSIYFLGAIV